MIFAIAEATVLGIAATVATLIGVVLTVAGYISNRKTAAEQANTEQYRQLLDCREENTRLSKELNELRRSLDD